MFHPPYPGDGPDSGGSGSGSGSGGGTGGGGSSGGDGGGSGSGGGTGLGGGSGGIGSGINVAPGWRPNPIPWNPPPPDIPPVPEPKRPCFDNAAVRANPLLKMKILGTKNNGIAGGRYGMGRGRMHNGIDLVAEVGTPVYAMFDGEIKYKVDRYDPKLPYKQYPYKYPGDKQENYNAGNRVWIECVTSKGRIILKYFHLNSIIVKVGDVVSVGDLIGYAGITGSACSSGCAGPHLHLEVWNNGTRVNPEPYLYTQFNQWGDAITKDCNE